MTAEELKEIIRIELTIESDIKNVFGLDLTKCGIEPVKQNYKKSNDSTDTYELWTVLEEREDKVGYKIYFDEETKMFGLAIKSDRDELIDIGLYGTFLRTLYSMGSIAAANIAFAHSMADGTSFGYKSFSAIVSAGITLLVISS